MRGLFLVALVLQCLLAVVSLPALASDDDATSFWDFVVKDGAGTSVPLHKFQDAKAILIVNVASACGYTDQNYKELQMLYEKYHSVGLEILGFPCNQFGGQEPNGNEQILQFVQEQYKVSFPIFAKVLSMIVSLAVPRSLSHSLTLCTGDIVQIDVNGEDAHPLFKYLTTKLAGFVTNDIKWNFTKFLVVNGVPSKRYGTTTSPLQIESDIVAALGLSAQNEKEL
jgi:glutathione peroxidase